MHALGVVGSSTFVVRALNSVHGCVSVNVMKQWSIIPGIIPLILYRTRMRVLKIWKNCDYPPYPSIPGTLTSFACFPMHMLAAPTASISVPFVTKFRSSLNICMTDADRYTYNNPGLHHLPLYISCNSSHSEPN